MLLLFSLLVGCALLLFVPVLQVAYYRWRNPRNTNLMWIQYLLNKKHKSPCNLQSTWISIESISPHFILAVCLIEDDRFFSHRGFILKNQFRALKADLMGKWTPGFSTITQQTAKNLFLYPGRCYFRKTVEMYYSCLLEVLWGKDRIMEVYLNVIEYSKWVYGLENGAKHWFGKSSKDFCYGESFLLASMIANPRLDLLKRGGDVWATAVITYNRGQYASRPLEKSSLLPKIDRVKKVLSMEF